MSKKKKTRIYIADIPESLQEEIYQYFRCEAENTYIQLSKKFNLPSYTIRKIIERKQSQEQNSD